MRGPLIHGSIVTTLIVINIAVYVVGMLGEVGATITYGWGVMQGEAVLHGQVWRLFTAQYLHDPMGIWHLALNMIGLHFLGRPLERMWSARKFFVIYTLSGLAGNLFYTLLAFLGTIDPMTPALGASGCIFGLLGVVAVMFPHATVYVYFLFPIKIRTAAIIFGGIALLTILQRGANYGGEACHLAGLVFGVWWAWRGEGWWQSRRGRSRSFSSPKGIREHIPSYLKPSKFADHIAGRRIDQVEVDRILKKVYESGLHSLSESEKEYLQEATDRQRQRDIQSGRVDRL